MESYGIVRDDAPEIAVRIDEVLDRGDIQALILNGGTGLAPRDTTFEVVRQVLEKEITGFGELFRYLSYKEIGAAAMLSRATAGIARCKVVISVPGSTPAVDLAMTRLVLPELGHMVFLARGTPEEAGRK